MSERTDGRWVEYRLAEDDETRAVVDTATRPLTRDAQLRSDRSLLTTLRRVPLERLCGANLDPAKLGLAGPSGRAGGRRGRRP